jgi:GT2 family glycosyltransferase
MNELVLPENKVTKPAGIENGLFLNLLKQLSVVIINYNSGKFLPACLEALDSPSSPYFGKFQELIVIDNASIDNSRSMVLPFEQNGHVCWVDAGSNLGYSGAANLAFQITTGRFIALMNPDVLVGENCLEYMIGTLSGFEGRQVGIAGCKLVYPYQDQSLARIQHITGKLSFPLALTQHPGAGELENAYLPPTSGMVEDPETGLKALKADYVTGALMMIKRDLINDIGGFDELFAPAYFEETDFCFRARKAGWLVVSCIEARSIHYESGGVGKASANYFYLYHLNRLRFVFKHWTLEQLEKDFFPKESERFRDLARIIEKEIGSSEELLVARREFQALEKVYNKIAEERNGSEDQTFVPGIDFSYHLSDENLHKISQKQELSLNLIRIKAEQRILERRWKIMPFLISAPPESIRNNWRNPRKLPGLIRTYLTKKIQQLVFLPQLRKLAAEQELFNASVLHQLTALSAVMEQLVEHYNQVTHDSVQVSARTEAALAKLQKSIKKTEPKETLAVEQPL